MLMAVASLTIANIANADWIYLKPSDDWVNYHDNKDVPHIFKLKDPPMELRIWRRIFLSPFVRLNFYTKGFTISFGRRDGSG